jgi:enoyl-CoA hydratase/carnithine racemase
LSNLEIEWLDECVCLRLAGDDTNVLTTESITSLSNAFVEHSDSARGILLCGGEKFFSNGVDLNWALQQSGEEIRRMFLALGHCILNALESPIPVVGVATGHAIGGALAILLACDYRYAATGRVLLGKPEILLGVPNPYYGDQLLRFIAGDFVASDLIYTGKLVPAEDAIALGLIHEVAEKSAVETLAWEKLRFLVGLSGEAFSESKKMRIAKLCADIRTQLSSRVARQVEIWNSAKAQEKLKEAAIRLSRKP